MHAQHPLWETYARAHATIWIAFFEDYYGKKDVESTEDDAAIIKEVLLSDEEACDLELECFTGERVAEEDCDDRY